MNNSHLHLVLNHLPIIFPIVGIIILIIGIFSKSEITKRNAYIIFILGALSAIAAMGTGDGAEETVEKIAGISENLIKKHEESAELFAGISYFLGGISLIALFGSLKNLSFSKFSPFVIGVFALAAIFFAKNTGTTGGEIRHTEIRSGANLQNNDESEKESKYDFKKNDEDNMNEMENKDFEKNEKDSKDEAKKSKQENDEEDND
jgi:hypothetical protein